MNDKDIVQSVIFGILLMIVACAILYAHGENKYKEGYTMSLVNQEKGTPHDFILEEQDNGEFVWVENKGGKWE